MAYRLVVAKPLSKLILKYCELEPEEKNFNEIVIRIQTFSLIKNALKVDPH